VNAVKNRVVYPTREDFERMKGRPLTVDEEGVVEEIEKLKAAER